jgi:hypothetical protein
VSEGVECDSADAVAFEFVCYVGSLDSKVSCEVSAAAGKSLSFLEGKCSIRGFVTKSKKMMGEKRNVL